MVEPRRRLRVLVLAEQCNPEWPSLPIVGFKYARALSEFCDVVVVTQVRNEAAIRRHVPQDTSSLEFVFLDTEYVAAPMHRLAAFIRGDPEAAWSTGMMMAYLPYLEFERQAWRQFRHALRAREFDLVHRITPMSPTLPSYIAGRGPIPFVIGPLNGNLDWPPQFAAEQKREKERLRVLRDAARFLPYARRTWRRSDLVLAAFQHTAEDLTTVPPDRLVMFPEVGYDETIFYPPDHLTGAPVASAQEPDAPLTFLYAGRLVPYKLAEVAIRAFAGSEVLRHRHRLRLVGDGPEMDRLRRLVAESGAQDSITFEGRLDQAGVAQAMRESEVLVSPSIRELGAGVVVEAMACGLMCLVVDYGGPADLIGPGRGHKVAMAGLDDLVVAFRTQMERTASPEGRLELAAARREAARYARDSFRWQHKAEVTEGLYRSLLD